MNDATKAKLAEILAFGRTGLEIYPMMFQPMIGRSNAVSAAIRVAKARGLIAQAGVDGCGKPIYRVTVPAATHAGSTAPN